MSLPITVPAPLNSMRPKCHWCARPLRPRYYRRDDEGIRGYAIIATHRTWSGGYEGYGHFCTLRCGAAWANRAINRGGQDG